MARSVRLSVEEKLYGLALIWQEANYNFAFFDRVPGLDWDASYREFIPQVIAAQDLDAYYNLLSRFTALLRDGHTYVISPKSLYLILDRPKLMVMNIENRPIVTNASCTIGRRVPIGSELLEIDGSGAKQALDTRVIPAVCETTPHRLLDHATARLLLGLQGSKVRCKFHTPGGDSIEIALVRNRRMDTDPWLRPHSIPFKWEFMYLDEKWLSEAPFSAFEFELLEGNVAYIALNSFREPTVAPSFTTKLPAIKDCAGLILDLRKNHGGSDATGYSIVSHFLNQPTETIRVQSPKHIASYKASGRYLRDTPEDKVAGLDKRAREQLSCYRKQWMHKEGWGDVQPAHEILSLPTAILTSSETGSAAEDFVMAFESGGGKASRIGQSTAGSSGQPLGQELPGGGRLAICTIRMPWPEKVWRKGIEPHVCVEPTIQDIIGNQDRVLTTAVRYLGGKEGIA
jgi:carboxyl-terminal processing protease